MKILFWDIETFPLVVTSWTLFKPRLSHDNILEGTTLISAAWKVLGDSNVYAACIDPKSPRDDKSLVKAVRAALVDADVLVAHNGDKFDLKKFNARLIYHGLEPLPPIKTVDTYKVAKKYFSFDSSRLDYLGEFLGLGRKLHTSYSLWLKILFEHDTEALETMVKYNKQDVVLLEKIYKKLRPFMQDHPNRRLIEGKVCPICGKRGSLQKRGYRLTRKTRYERYQCQKCGGWSSGEVVDKEKIA